MTIAAAGVRLEELPPEDLVAILIDAHGVSSVEHLGDRSTLSLRTLRRWQSEGYPSWWPKSVGLIRELGLLRSDADRNGGSELDHLSDLAEAVRVLVRGQEQVLDDLREVQKQLAAAVAVARQPAATHPRRQAARASS